MNKVYRITFKNEALGKFYQTQMEAENEELLRLQFADHYQPFCKIKRIEELNQAPRNWEEVIACH